MTTDQLVGLSNSQLADVDPLMANLVVARGVSEWQQLDIEPYQRLVNHWGDDFQSRCLPGWEPYFHERPGDFRNDIRFFRLGMIAQYLDREIGISYNADQRHVDHVRYLDASDLFLHGVLDSRQGTCANMAVLHVAMAWRVGLPVALACVGSHLIARYDDGQVAHNIESTRTGLGGFDSRSDRQCIGQYGIRQKALTCGSDLRALSPREQLGVFVGLRARYFRDVAIETGKRGHLRRAERDYLLARYLFPAHRIHHRELAFLSAHLGDERFEPDEAGHPHSYDRLHAELRAFECGRHFCQRSRRRPARRGDATQHFSLREGSDAASH